MGRVLLADLPGDELDAFLADVELEPFTEHTITDRGRLRAVIDGVRENGWALMDQELELGLRSVAAPLRTNGRTVAALNVAVGAPRVSLDELRGAILPELVSAAARISAALERAGQAPSTVLSSTSSAGT
jgi:IclR family pca regulon transcriptional regulator